MAITDVPAYAHLTEADIESLGNELDAIRQDIEESLGEKDSRYIRRTIAAAACSGAGGRLDAGGSSKRSMWWAGTAMLGVAKIIENMETRPQRHARSVGLDERSRDPLVHLGVGHGRGVRALAAFTHNFMHHKYTNILGMDDDVGYGLLRVTRDQRWKPINAGQPALQHAARPRLRVGHRAAAPRARQDLQGPRRPGGHDDARARVLGVKAGNQVVKDYVAYPALTSLSPGATWKSTLKANAVANVIRNVWTNAVIFCGHFPDGAEKFTKTDMVGETQGAVVPAPDAGQRQLRGRPGDGAS